MSRAETTWKMVIVGIAFCGWGAITPNAVIASTHTLADEPPPPKVAALLNLHVQDTLVHLFCDRNHTACRATFFCDGPSSRHTDFTAEWEVSIQPNEIFAYYRMKTLNGQPAGFGDVWREKAGSTARAGRTTCIVRSNDPVEARAYTKYGGSGELVPASNRIHPPEPYPSARLSGLTVSQGTLSPAFASSTGTYTLTMPTGATKDFTFTPTAEESRAEIKVQGTVEESGKPTIQTFPLDLGGNKKTLTIVVTSYDGTILTYYVNYTPRSLPPSSPQ